MPPTRTARGTRPRASPTLVTAATGASRPTLIAFVRHAESARNVAKKGNRFFLDDEARKSVKGVPDHHTPLTERGRRQATDTGVKLRDDLGVFDYAYYSGYRRTEETLQGLIATYSKAERSRLQVRHHLFLRERDTRAYLFLSMLFRERAGKRVMVVTHGGTLWMFRMLLERWTWDEAAEHFHAGTVPQCNVTSYAFDARAKRLVLQELAKVYYATAGRT